MKNRRSVGPLTICSFFAFATLAVLATPAVSGEPDFCASIQHVSDAAKDKFVSLRGMRDNDTHSWSATIALPRAYRCRVDDDSYTCYWKLKTEEQARRAYSDFLDGLQNCANWRLDVGTLQKNNYGFSETESQDIFTDKGIDFELSYSHRLSGSGGFDVSFTITPRDY